MFVIPPFLQKGDLVLIIGTARARNRESIQPCIDKLRDWGFRVQAGPHLYEVHHQFAGTDLQRAEDLQWALDHHEAKAIIIAGGGYGSLRIIDSVDFTRFQRSPKWLVGYSDTTVIHSRITELGIAAIHGTMAFQFNKDKEATESVFALMTGKQQLYDISLHPLNRAGQARARVVGGNLSLIYALGGSRDDLQTKDCILFIEDLDEQLYHIDRMMLQLKRSGKLDSLAGLVVGGMTEMKDNAVPFGKTAEEIILDAIREHNYPVCFNFPAGHIQRNMALYLGAEAELTVTSKGAQLIYHVHQ